MIFGVLGAVEGFKAYSERLKEHNRVIPVLIGDLRMLKVLVQYGSEKSMSTLYTRAREVKIGYRL